MSRTTLPISRAATRSALCVLTLVTASCSGSLFKVKPLNELPAMPASSASANVGSLSFRASPLLTDEEEHELVESNLELAGVFPVRLEIGQNSDESGEIRKLKFRLNEEA